MGVTEEKKEEVTEEKTEEATEEKKGFKYNPYAQPGYNPYAQPYNPYAQPYNPYNPYASSLEEDEAEAATEKKADVDEPSPEAKEVRRLEHEAEVAGEEKEA